MYILTRSKPSKIFNQTPKRPSRKLCEVPSIPDGCKAPCPEGFPSFGFRNAKPEKKFYLHNTAPVDEHATRIGTNIHVIYLLNKKKTKNDNHLRFVRDNQQQHRWYRRESENFSAWRWNDIICGCEMWKRRSGRGRVSQIESERDRQRRKERECKPSHVYTGVIGDDSVRWLYCCINL